MTKATSLFALPIILPLVAHAGQAELRGEVPDPGGAFVAGAQAVTGEVRTGRAAVLSVIDAIQEFRIRTNSRSMIHGGERAGAHASHEASAKSPRVGSDEPGHREGWFERVARTQSKQPHWITPLVTVTPRLEEEVRFDIPHQVRGDGSSATSYGGGKGLELIPAERIELIFGVPPYIEHEPARGRNGVGDLSFLVKYRVLSANEQKGNYILTFFLGATAPTASNGNGAGHAIYTPTVAFGKGWGQFDVQTTLGVGLPGGGRNKLGTSVTHNVAFQYRVFKKLWPELEVNTTWWPNGEKAGNKQVFLTPGILVGRFSLWKRLGLTVGAGVQIAVTDYRAYDHSVILSIRLPF